MILAAIVWFAAGMIELRDRHDRRVAINAVHRIRHRLASRRRRKMFHPGRIVLHRRAA